ncbi:MAG: GNAT family N-acetyltransferase [Candidatus Methylacidiphilales bacterium]|nr:GNAT family N-acetyltransferase [Candidatus Methylacidiphilales bacterium]
MIVRVFDAQSPPDAPMLAALAEFERSFRYPLGTTQYFHISHGAHYLPFFHAMGRAALFVALREERVLGTIACIERTLHHDGETIPAAYLCDLKMAPDARQTRVMPRLILSAATQCRERNITRAWSVVMRGTTRTPSTYTGRLEIPEFIHGGEITVMRLASRGQCEVPQIRTVSPEVISDARERISRHGYVAANGNSSLRSQMAPVHLLTADGRACGTLEDTLLGKRLMIGGDGGAGGELLSTHLSGFAWSDPASGADLLRQAVSHSAALGISGLFVSLPQSAVQAFAKELEDLSCTLAPADIYVHGLPPDPHWWIDTADI